jgi:hypothetical protein
MYYVVQELHGAGDKHFISYQVPKYILSNKNENVIFEFGEKPNVKRKWANKGDIVLLTDNKAFFLAFVEKLKSMEKEHLEKINQAQKELEKLIEQYQDSMHDELDSFKQLALENSNVPSLL